MARGMRWCEYVDDTGAVWSLQVDADSAEDSDRGWQLVGDPAPPIWPRGWRPRQVEGLEPNGRRRRTRIARVDAPLWTGGVVEFLAETNALEVVTVHVLAYLEERRVPAPRSPAE